AITSRLDTLETTYDKAKVGLDAILELLTDIGDVYAKAEPAERRMLNRALFDRITIDDEDQATLEPVEAIETILAANPRSHNERTLPRDQAGQGSNVQLYVDAGGLKPNTWRRFERLGSAWEQAKLGVGDEPQGAVEDEPGVVSNPRRRARTPLTDSQVDAIRTAPANGQNGV